MNSDESCCDAPRDESDVGLMTAARDNPSAKANGRLKEWVGRDSCEE